MNEEQIMAAHNAAVRRRRERADIRRQNRRIAEQDRARELKAACDAIVRKPLRDELPADDKAEISERVKRGLRPLRGSSIGSGL